MSTHSKQSMSGTYWARDPKQVPLYSDWTVSFTTSTSTSKSLKDSNNSNKHQDNDTESISTAAMTVYDDGHTVTDESHTADDGDTDDDNDGNESIISKSPSSSSSSHGPQEEEEQQQQHPKKQEVSFAVHRNMIGPRSEYFTKSFLSRTLRDQNNNTSSVIQLPSTLSTKAFHTLLDAFEVLLDYCYNSIADDFTNTKLTTDNAVAMYCLCNYFEMDKEVCAKIQAFISKDLNEHTVATYYQNVKDLRSTGSNSSSSSSSGGRSSSSMTTTPSMTKGSSSSSSTDGDNNKLDSNDFLLNVNPIHEMVAFLCYKHPTVLSDNDFLTKQADLALWLSIGTLLAAGNTNDVSDTDTGHNKAIEKDSKVWSQNLTAFFDTMTTTTANTSGVDAADDFENLLELKETFRILTSSKVLPVIHESVALRLLQHERLHGLADQKKEVHSNDDGDHDDHHHDHGDDASTTIEQEYTLWASSDDDASNTTANKNGGGNDELDSMIEICDKNIIVPDGTTNEEKEEQPQQHPHSVTHKTTSLQRRCIKALASGNWSGAENDVEMLRGTGKLTQMTTPIVLEELLIGSVIGERKLGTKLTVLQAEVRDNKQVHIDENIKTHEQIRTLKVDLIKEEQKQYRLAKVLEDEATKREAAEKKLVQFDLDLEDEKKKLCKMNAELEAKLEEEKKRSYSLDLRYRALEFSRRKTESDREMLELTCTETVTRLDAMSSQEEWWNNACGVMSPLILMLSTMSDRRECEKIKHMLQQVVEDPSSYERDFLLKNVGEDGEEYTVGTLSNVGTLSKMEDDEHTFRTYESNDDDQTMVTSMNDGDSKYIKNHL